jgi:hypothetical protein
MKRNEIKQHHLRFYFSLATPSNSKELVEEVRDACSNAPKKTVLKRTPKGKTRKLLPTFPCKTRKGMTVAADTAWHKRGFDSLTCKNH